MSQPDIISWTNMISAYSNSGNLQESQSLFDKMKSAGLEPNEFTWNALITGSGKMEMAYELLRELGVRITDSMVGAFLNGCVVYDRGDLVKKMSEDLVKRPGGFVGLCNVYAGEGEWGEVERLREVMKVHGVQREHGFSSLLNNM
ncbi:hypothetical protein L2E82_44953 [Cichorium intybus]|uniref:Uncharacterized protein n=1 Tax=Cichorium intybus TaxID=13427 RepID=A0ACB8ZQN0_CICIN|nr:hypothetical protein L2E82_44953 [Cichorium intybus]